MGSVVGGEQDHLYSAQFFPLRCVCQRLGAYDRLVAAVAGALKDEFGEGGPSVRAEIFDDGRFERLEAEGRAEFAAKLEEMQKLFSKDGLSHNGKE